MARLREQGRTYQEIADTVGDGAIRLGKKPRLMTHREGRRRRRGDMAGLQLRDRQGDWLIARLFRWTRFRDRE